MALPEHFTPEASSSGIYALVVYALYVESRRIGSALAPPSIRLTSSPLPAPQPSTFLSMTISTIRLRDPYVRRTLSLFLLIQADSHLLAGG
jgi:hypothetical protein